MTDVLDVRAMIEARRAEAAAARAARHRYIRPLSAAGQRLVEEFSSTADRWFFGIPTIDNLIRGVGRGHLCMISGKSHNGKTQVALQSVANNPHKRVLWFTPDESAELVLAKLIAMTHGIPSDTLEVLIRDGDEEAIGLVNHYAVTVLSNLVVVDDTLTIQEMGVAAREAEEFLGGPLDAVFVDFIDLVLADGEAAQDPKTKAKQLKALFKALDVPGIVLAQNSRTSSPPGKAAGMTGMAYGGESEAIYVVEVYRRMFDQDLDEFERRKHMNTLTVNVCKNKRPPCRKGEGDLFIDPLLGKVRELCEDDFPAVGPQTLRRADELWRGGGR